MLDEGGSTSTGETINATNLSETLCRVFKVEPPRTKYLHGWGENCLQAKLVVESWYLYLRDNYRNTIVFYIGIVDGESPLIVCLDVKTFSKTDNKCIRKEVTLRKPVSNNGKILSTYIALYNNTEPIMKSEIVLKSFPQLRKLWQGSRCERNIT